MSETIYCDVLVVGAGPAGLSAAAKAAEAGAPTVLLDENPFAGGQIWRPSGGVLNPNTRALLDRIWAFHVRQINSASVFDLNPVGIARASTPLEAVTIHFKNVILATGARELFLPFPGWTLPNVFGAGALQAVVKSGLNVEGKRVVVAGSGPLLPEVGDFLAAHGAKVAGVYEQTARHNLTSFALGLIHHRSKLKKALTMTRAAARIRSGHWVCRAFGNGHLESVEVTDGWATSRVECDYLACGFGLVPNVELACLAGCKLDRGFVQVDELQRTTVPNVFCAGEPTMIGGVDLSMIEGEIAGLAAAGAIDQAKTWVSRRDHERKFGDLLKRCFALREELKTLADPSTIVCRCEDVPMERLMPHKSAREAKIYARCGMGPCQGRVCGPATRFLFGWESLTVRPPITPIPLEDLVDSDLSS